MDRQFDPEQHKKDIGKAWMLTNGTLLANVETATRRSIVKEVEFAYLYYSDICKILKISGCPGGMIIEKQNSTLMMCNLIAENDVLISAEGEWIGNGVSCLDYCLARI